MKPDAIHIGSILLNNPLIFEKLPPQYHQFMVLFDPAHAEKLPDDPGCDHMIELKGSEEDLRMGPIYQLSQEDAKILVHTLKK